MSTLTIVIIVVIIIAVVMLLRMSSPLPIHQAATDSCSSCKDSKSLGREKFKTPKSLSEFAREKDVELYNSTVASRTFIPPSNPLYQANPNNPDLEYVDVNLINHPNMQESYSYMNFKALHEDQRRNLA